MKTPPDWSPGEVIAAYEDGTIVLDDGITTWNPERAEAFLAQKRDRMIVGPQQKPLPHPFYGDTWERGLDPWHADAFPDGLKDAGTTGERKAGWFLLDGFGNAIAFVEDGTVICKWCAEGPPEFSKYSKVWIHRRERLDRRCDNPPHAARGGRFVAGIWYPGKESL